MLRTRKFYIRSVLLFGPRALLIKNFILPKHHIYWHPTEMERQRGRPAQRWDNETSEVSGGDR